MFKKSSPPAAISAERMQYLKQTRRHRIFVNLTRIGILVAFLASGKLPEGLAGLILSS